MNEATHIIFDKIFSENPDYGAHPTNKILIVFLMWLDLSRVYTIRDATWRDMTRHSSIVHTMGDIVVRRHVAAGDLGSGANEIR